MPGRVSCSVDGIRRFPQRQFISLFSGILGPTNRRTGRAVAITDGNPHHNWLVLQPNGEPPHCICIPVHLGAESSRVRCCIRAAERCILATARISWFHWSSRSGMRARPHRRSSSLLCRIGIPAHRYTGVGSSRWVGWPVRDRLRCCFDRCAEKLARAFPCGTGHSCDLCREPSPAGGTSDSWIVIITVCPTAAAVWIAITIPSRAWTLRSDSMRDHTDMACSRWDRRQLRADIGSEIARRGSQSATS